MPNPNHIQYQIDKGRGKAAEALGGPFNVYRLQAASSATDFIDPANLVASNYLIYHLQRSASGFRGSFEGTSIGLPLFDIIGNMQPFVVGDVFIDADVAYTPGGSTQGYGAGATSVSYSTLEIYGWCLGFHGPIKKSIGARIDRLGSIYRLPSTPASGYYAADLSACRPVQIASGQVVVGTPGATAALIPVGFMARDRWRTDLLKQLPTSTGEVEYMAYIPPLPGFTFKESDRIVLQDGSQYVVQSPWEQEVGFAGSQVSLKRLAMQA